MTMLDFLYYRFPTRSAFVKTYLTHEIYFLRVMYDLEAESQKEQNVSQECSDIS
ncbi:hypothetical protein TMatcc_006112 [Talaromyces marneffei ATCC 18224]